MTINSYICILFYFNYKMLMCRLITNTYDGSGMVKLYRYDLECPPTDWSNEYKNVEYIYEGECDALRVKNQIGAFFFFENISTAYATGSIAAKKNGTNTIWLTETSIINRISLLEFSHLKNISSILLAFEELGIDVLNDSFFKFNSCGACESFEKLRPLLDELKDLDQKEHKNDREIMKISDLAYEIGKFFYSNERIDYFGQLLTDFGNGNTFKNILTEKGYDGYIFREDYNSSTYCLFEASALSKPQHKKVTIS